MIYHGFYKEQVHFLCDRFPLYAGLFLPNFKSPEELEKGIMLALQNGAGGVSLFGKVNDWVLKVLKTIG